MPTDPPDEVDELCQDILGFLLDHPQAQDTLEGIAEWWLLEREVRREVVRVRKALENLIAQGWLIERRAADGSVRYGLNEVRRRAAGAARSQEPREPEGER